LHLYALICGQSRFADMADLEELITISAPIPERYRASNGDVRFPSLVLNHGGSSAWVPNNQGSRWFFSKNVEISKRPNLFRPSDVSDSYPALAVSISYFLDARARLAWGRGCLIDAWPPLPAIGMADIRSPPLYAPMVLVGTRSGASRCSK